MEKHFFQTILEGDYSEAEILGAFEDNYDQIILQERTPEIEKIISNPKINEPLKLIGLRRLTESSQDQLFEDFDFLIECQRLNHREILKISGDLIDKLNLPEYLTSYPEKLIILRHLTKYQYSENRRLSNLTMNLVLSTIKKNPGFFFVVDVIGYVINCQDSDDEVVKVLSQEIALTVKTEYLRKYFKDIIESLKIEDAKGKCRGYFQRGGPDSVKLAEDLLFVIDPSDFNCYLEYFINSQKNACSNTRSITEKLALRLPPDFLGTKFDPLFDYLASESANVRILATKLLLLIPSQKIYPNLRSLIKTVEESSSPNVCRLARKLALKIDQADLLNDYILFSSHKNEKQKTKDLRRELAKLAEKSMIRPEKVAELKLLIA